MPFGSFGAVFVLSALWVPLGMADDVVERARVLAAGKDRAEALALLASRLSEEPGDLDARTLTGTILSWEGRYAEARGQLEAVLEAEPGHGDATLALIHLELWSGNGARAEQLANKAVASRPDSAPYQAVLERVQRERRPESEDERPAIKWQAGVERSYIWFSDTQESWRESKVSANVETRAGLVAVHASQAARGRLIDRIVELEMYPRLSRKSYAHIIAGFSPDATLYARRRYGAEVYHALPARFEGSVGFRQYVFGERVDLVTGSIGRYYGNWFFSARPFIDRSSFGISQSLQLNAKRYLGRRGSFWNTRAGWGASPMEVRSINEAGIRSSLSFFQDLNLLLPNGFQLRLSGGVATQNRRDRGALRQYGLSGTLLYGF